MCDSATVRTLHTAILPPGPAHVDAVRSLTVEDAADLASIAGTTSSLIADFLVKTMGVGHIKVSTLGKIPHLRGHVLEQHLILRTLRLNCLVREYAPLWSELFDPRWQHDSWTPGLNAHGPFGLSLGDVQPNWSAHTPLRSDADRRIALIEIDAIVAVMLGITADELLTIYRTQFPVLQKYEREALYDTNGRQLPTKLASEYRKRGTLPTSDLTVDGITYEEPIRGVDREHDMQIAHAHFSALNSSL